MADKERPDVLDRTLSGHRAVTRFWGGLTGTVVGTYRTADGMATTVIVDVNPGRTTANGRPLTRVSGSITRWDIEGACA